MPYELQRQPDSTDLWWIYTWDNGKKGAVIADGPALHYVGRSWFGWRGPGKGWAPLWDLNIDYGPKWQNRLPPGLPIGTRQPDGRQVLDQISGICHARGIDESCASYLRQLARHESGAVTALPAHTFDARQAAPAGADWFYPTQRGHDVPRITAWGAFQFNRDAWRGLSRGVSWAGGPTPAARQISADAMPWHCDRELELAAPCEHYASIYNACRARGMNVRQALTVTGMYHAGPAWGRRLFDEGVVEGLSKLPANARAWDADHVQPMIRRAIGN